MENIQNTQSGKTYREHFQAIKGETSTLSSKRSAPSVTMPYQSLNLMTQNEQVKLVWNKAEIVGDNYSIAWRTLDAQYWGVPQRRNESTLSQILQADAPEKYYLSPKACEGICRRAMKRGKVVTANALGGVDGRLLELSA